MVENYKSCLPSCESFRCGQRSLNNAGKRVYCRWADDDCVGPSCNYAMCIRGKLLSGGACGLYVRRQTSETMGPEAIKVENIRLRGKLHHRFKDDDMI